MTTKKISELTAATSVTGTEVIALVQDGATKRTTLNSVFDSLGTQTITLSGDISGSGTTAITATLADVNTSGAGTFNSLTVNAKGLVIGATNVSYATVATTGSYADLTNKPILFSGSYNDLSNKPTLFSGSYNDLSNKPTLFTQTEADALYAPINIVAAYDGRLDVLEAVDHFTESEADAKYPQFADLTPLAACRLNYIGATEIRLVPYNGNKLFINGAMRTIPAAGASLSASGLSASTLYYIYAYMNGTTLTLEASTTAYAMSSIYGHPIKNDGGPGTRTLVGIVRTNASSQFANSEQTRFVRSYFNRPAVKMKGTVSGTITTTSLYNSGNINGTMVEISANARLHFVAWDDDLVYGHFYGTVYADTATSSYSLVDMVDESNNQLGGFSIETGNLFNNSHQTVTHVFSTGYHYMTPRFAIGGQNGTVTANNMTTTGSISPH